MYIELRKASWFFVLRANAAREADRVRVYSHDDLTVQCLLDLADGETAEVECRLNAWGWRQILEAWEPQPCGWHGPFATSEAARADVGLHESASVEIREVE